MAYMRYSIYAVARKKSVNWLYLLFPSTVRSGCIYGALIDNRPDVIANCIRSRLHACTESIVPARTAEIDRIFLSIDSLRCAAYSQVMDRSQRSHCAWIYACIVRTTLKTLNSKLTNVG